MKKLVLLIGLLISPFTYAEEPLESYVARLSAADHENSDGKRLKSVGDILRQDRANFHKFNIIDSEDQSDSMFGDVKARERIPMMLQRGHIDKETKIAILNGTPVVLVNIYKNRIEVYQQ
ncbi:hypothetical protein DOJK_02065 [Patescibacteria group bacterium]|nr:hypothetical protein DOJK_02065 [Patescibacteria group bacterium]